jgi:hypothetical protein
MKKTCSWLVVLASLVTLAGTTHAGAPALTTLVLPQLFGQDARPPEILPTSGSVRSGPSQSVRVENGVVIDSEAQKVAPKVTPALSDWQIVQRKATPEGDTVCDAILGGLFHMFRYGTSGGAVRWAADLACDLFAMQQMSLEIHAEAVSDAEKQFLDALQSGLSRSALAPAPEVLPMPKVVAVPDGGSVWLAGQWIRVPAASCSHPCTGEKLSCTKAGGSCGVCAKPDLTGIAEACENDLFALAKSTVKACKCCEDCADCKDCTCGKKTTYPVPQKSSLPATRDFAVNAGSGMRNSIVVAVEPPPPFGGCPQAGCPITSLPMVPRPIVVPFGPVTSYPVPMPMHEAMPYSVQELKDLIHQRQMVTCAIEQIERELMRLTFEKYRAQPQVTPVAHNVQKVHLVTEHFEAHCDSLRCLDGDHHRLVLEGDVRMTCKKSGQTVRIEAACIIVNMKDGTFSVTSQAVQGPQVMKHVEPTHWGTYPPATSYPVTPSPQGWQVAPTYPAPPQSPPSVGIRFYEQR